MIKRSVRNADAARALEISPSTLCNVFSGRQKNFRDETCAKIEAYTGGEVDFRSLRLWNAGKRPKKPSSEQLHPAAEEVPMPNHQAPAARGAGHTI